MTTMQTFAAPSVEFERVASFVRNASIANIPQEVIHTAKLLILDLIGVLAAGSKLDAGRISRDHAANYWASGPNIAGARLLFDGRNVSLPGFGFAMAAQIDNLDAHDGWQPSKGHAGAALFPALAAFAEAEKSITGQEAIVAMVIGYELAYRAAYALHETVTDYHTSGAWNALGCAAIGARIRKLDDDSFRHSLGVAEFIAPRSQMMREIANPSMLHDGTGWGAPTGIHAVLIAEDGFEGAPAATVEFDDASFAWQDLGSNWLTIQQYIKPYPICRWAHAPIDASLKLREKHSIKHEDIETIKIETFSYSADLNCEIPKTTSQAQYSLAWPVAAVLVRGKVGVDEVIPDSFTDSKIINLTNRTNVDIDSVIESEFPAKRLANVIIKLKNGEEFKSGITEASGGPDPQPTADEVIDKFRIYAGTVMDESRVSQIEKKVLSLDEKGSDFKALLDILAKPLD